MWIARCAPEWPVEELAVVDRNVLRLCLWEFAVSAETPTKVAINEAVELAKLFGSDSAPRFINGVLGTLSERLDDIRRELVPAG
jgi:N utilization substance protein B